MNTKEKLENIYSGLMELSDEDWSNEQTLEQCLKEIKDLAEDFFYLDLADEGYWLIRSRDGKRYTAGDDKQKVQDLIKRLNETHRPNIHQGEMHEVFVCWNEHEKGEECNYEKVL